MNTRILIFFIAGLFSFFSANAQKDKRDIHEPFQVGQVWRYFNRPGEEKSTVTILKIEKYPNSDTIIHIRVDGVTIYNSKSASGYSDFLGHLPFSKNALDLSVIELVGKKDTLPDFQEGYREWKTAWSAGKGGFWTIELRKAIDGVDQAMRPKN